MERKGWGWGKWQSAVATSSWRVLACPTARAARSHESGREAPAPHDCMAAHTYTHAHTHTHSEVKGTGRETHSNTCMHIRTHKSTGIHTPMCTHTHTCSRADGPGRGWTARQHQRLEEEKEKERKEGKKLLVESWKEKQDQSYSWSTCMTPATTTHEKGV